MYIKRLTIKETKPSEKIVREIPFQLGLNFIVDAGIDQEKGNSVGKTTVLRLIDIALGAKDRKYIYYNEETQKTNNTLKSYIEEKKVQVELLVVDSFEDDEKMNNYLLAVDLFPRGKRFIDGLELNQNDYWKKLNVIFFSNIVNSPSFRQLIHMFVRIDQRSDNNKFLKFLTRTNDATYENIYSYLFDLQEQEISNRVLELKQSFDEKDKELKNYMKLNDFKSIDIINQKVILLESKIKKLNAKMEILVESKKFKENEEKISEIKIQYAQYKDNIDELLFKKQRIVDILNDAKSDKANMIDKDILKTLYDETSEIMGELNKEFEDLLRFNKELMQNKLNYFSLQLEKTNKKIKSIEIKKNQLFEKHRNVIMLIEENKIDEYTFLKNKLSEYSEELGKDKNVRDTYNNIKEKLDELVNELDNVEGKDDIQQDSISIFNEFFSKYSEETNGEPFMLFKTTSGFPFGIDYVKKGLSTGTRKSIIVAFDLAYQQLAKKLEKNVPNFIIHDVIETIDQVALSAIANIVNSMESQYIVAVLKEKIDGNEFITKSDIAVTLSEGDRPFKI
ncbi:hypothetical protein B7C51_09785 [Paenibacillus larvae subsp. pulvifaciens]|uniref:DUF2326 domain-containing protein n=1 Tax=Paenibacillus larvae subsp. pulvifaciens TaxID=1477 RepID=A0A1V0USV6_9BACL|nr:hypothetical protein [Paenibacillus larvae]ARF68058.1 hypothetical protein B7C51_09785 [Paenibacillus larvae subsp. pulvifaciens]